MKVISLLFIPLFVLITSFFLSESRGPHWLGSVTDPDYAYLFNALSLIQGTPIAHLDHPGTPVQSLGQLVILTVGSFTPEPDFVSDVIQRPEFYLQAISIFFNLLIFFWLSSLGILVYRLTNNLITALFLQSTPFISVTLFGEPLTKVSTEPLILISSITFLVALSFIYFANQRRLSMLLFCISLGLGTSTKLTFFPLIVIPFLLYKPIREKITLILGSAFFFFVFTKPIVENYPRLWSWVKSLFVHSGRNAEGAATIIDWSTFLPNIWIQIYSEPLFFLVVFCEFLLLSFFVFKRDFSEKFFLLGGFFVAQIIQILLVAKHPGGSYLGPLLAVTLFSVIVITDIISENSNLKRYFTVIKNKNYFIGMLLILILFVGLIKLYNFNQSLIKLRDEEIKMNEIIETQYKNNLVIRYHRSSSQLYALKFGNTFISNNFTHYLNNIYPNTYFWDIWNARFSGWDMEPVDFNRIEEVAKNDPRYKNGDIVFTGTSFELHYFNYPNYKPKLSLKEVYPNADKSRDKETVYILDSDFNQR